MATPKGGYFLQNGDRVPGTTTIIGRFKESGALMYWAWDQGRKGLDYKETCRVAADAGTLAHSMAEVQLQGKDPNLVVVGASVYASPEVIAQAKSAFASFLSWKDHSRLEIVHQEIQMVSEEYKYGGTFDGIGLMDGKHSLIDFKTSNSLYSDYLIQLAAYAYLVENGVAMDTREGLGVKLDGGFHLLRFAKENGDFSHHYYPALPEAWEAFKHMRELYELDKVLKRRAK
jgi:hypothetical protein